MIFIAQTERKCISLNLHMGATIALLLLFQAVQSDMIACWYARFHEVFVTPLLYPLFLYLPDSNTA